MEKRSRRIQKPAAMPLTLRLNILKRKMHKPDPDRLSDPVITKAERNERIREEYAEGKTLRELAEKFGISQVHVSRICKGVTRKKIPKRKPDPEKEERNANIREEYRDGKTLRELAEKFGVTYQGIGYICKGVERKKGRKYKSVKEDAKAKIREEYREGKAQRELAEKFGISQVHVNRICKGVKNPKEERNAAIREWYAEGKTQRELAEKFGISIQSVYRICKGVQRRKR